MKVARIMAAAALIVGGSLALHTAQAQAPGITRTDLQQHDLSVPGREVVQVPVDFAPGVLAPAHNSGSPNTILKRAVNMNGVFK